MKDEVMLFLFSFTILLLSVQFLSNPREVVFQITVDVHFAFVKSLEEHSCGLLFYVSKKSNSYVISVDISVSPTVAVGMQTCLTHLFF